MITLEIPIETLRAVHAQLVESEFRAEERDER